MTAETSQTPDSGWHGDTRRGASMGRAARLPAAEKPLRAHLRQIRLDSGGYDPGGSYWGIGGRLYEAFTDCGEFYWSERSYLRGSAAARDAVKASILQDYPNMKFYR